MLEKRLFLVYFKQQQNKLPLYAQNHELHHQNTSYDKSVMAHMTFYALRQKFHLQNRSGHAMVARLNHFEGEISHEVVHVRDIQGKGEVHVHVFHKLLIWSLSDQGQNEEHVTHLHGSLCWSGKQTSVSQFGG